MRFASSITSATNARKAVEELLEPIDSRVTPGMVDLVVLFTTGDFSADLVDVIDRISEYCGNAVLLGCSAAGTIGPGKELERVPSMSLLAASLPGVEIRPFHLTQQDLERISSPLDWERIVGASPESNPTFVALGDPFRFAIHDFVEKIGEAYTGSQLVGGVASAARMPQKNRLVVNGDIYREGTVGIALTGRLRVDTVVSQGCRPIGKPFVITKADGNVIRELGGRASLEQLHDVLVKLPDEDERLARESLFVGRAIDEHQERFTRGSFLIHNIIGVDRKSGALAVGGLVRVGSTMQFHVRDAVSADDLLGAAAPGRIGASLEARSEKREARVPR